MFINIVQGSLRSHLFKTVVIFVVIFVIFVVVVVVVKTYPMFIDIV